MWFNFIRSAASSLPYMFNHVLVHYGAFIWSMPADLLLLEASALYGLYGLLVRLTHQIQRLYHILGTSE